MHLQIEPQDQIHKRPSQETDMPGKKHQLHFGRKGVNVWNVVRHDLPCKQERDYTEQSDDEMDAPHVNSMASSWEVLAAPKPHRKSLHADRLNCFRLLKPEHCQLTTLFLLRRFVEFLHPVAIFEDFARLGSVGWTDNAVLFHQINQSCGPPVADAQAALQRGCGSAASVANHADRILVKIVIDILAAFCIALAGAFGLAVLILRGR